MIRNYDKMWPWQRLAIRVMDRVEDDRVFEEQRREIAKAWGPEQAAKLGTWAPRGRRVVKIDNPEMSWDMVVIGDWRPWMLVNGKWRRCEEALMNVDREANSVRKVQGQWSGGYGWWQVRMTVRGIDTGRTTYVAPGQSIIGLEPPFTLTSDIEGAMVMHALSPKPSYTYGPGNGDVGITTK